MSKTCNEGWKSVSLNRNEFIALENFKALVGYIAAENKLFWDRLSIFAAIDAGLIGISYLDAVAKTPSAFLLSAFGFLASLLWFMATARSARYLCHWIDLAREIEEERITDLAFFKRQEEFLESCNSWYEKKSVTRFSATGIPYSFILFWTFRLGAYLSAVIPWVPLLWVLVVLVVLVLVIVLLVAAIVVGRKRNRGAIAIVAGGVSSPIRVFYMNYWSGTLRCVPHCSQR